MRKHKAIADCVADVTDLQFEAGPASIRSPAVSSCSLLSTLLK